MISGEKKGEALDYIFEHIFKSGFGTLGKFEIDTIFFAALLKYADADKVTDYKLSQLLQITQQRIRVLKEKVSVKYNIITRDAAIESFVEQLELSKRDDIYLDVLVKDISVKNEIEELMENKNIFMQRTRNPKIIRIRIDQLLDLCLLLQQEHSSTDSNAGDLEGQVLDNLRKNHSRFIRSVGTIENQTWDSIGKLMSGVGKDVAVEFICSLLPGGVILTKIGLALAKVLTNGNG